MREGEGHVRACVRFSSAQPQTQPLADAVGAQPAHCFLAPQMSEPTGHAISAKACGCKRDGRLTSRQHGKTSDSKSIVGWKRPRERKCARMAGNTAAFIC